VFQRNLVQAPSGKEQWIISEVHISKVDDRDPDFPIGYTITIHVTPDTTVHDPTEFTMQSGQRTQTYDTTD
jgi:hypothetical protein